MTLLQCLNWNLSTKYKLLVAYTGTEFYGYQIQNKFRTVEGEIFSVLNKICTDVKKISASGRTDTGVHAEFQPIGFITSKIFDINRTLSALRQLVPKDILIISLEQIDEAFDARRSAIKREYRYLFKPGMVPLYYKERIVEVRFLPKPEMFNELKNIIEGKHDFIRFRKEGSNELSTVRIIYDFSITEKKLKFLYDETHIDPSYFELKIVASGFLYRMVRNLTGAIFEIFKGKYSIEEFKSYFHGHESKFTYMPAPSKGLSLTRVTY